MSASLPPPPIATWVMYVLELRRGSVETGVSLVGFAFGFYFGIAKCGWGEGDVIVQRPGKDTSRICCFSFSVFFQNLKYCHILDLVSWESLIEQLFLQTLHPENCGCVPPEASCRMSPTSACVYVKHSWTLQLWGLEQAIHLKILLLKLLMPQLHEWTCLWKCIRYLRGTTKNIWVELRGSQGHTSTGRGNNWLYLDYYYFGNSICVPPVRSTLDTDKSSDILHDLKLVIMSCYQLSVFP